MGELRATNTDLNVEILGINKIGSAGSNPLMTAGRTLPWLQDTTQLNIWDQWGVTYRDVWVLDSKNEVTAVYNLTTYDLSIAANRAELKQLFLDAAQAVDSDADGLPDDWEMQFLGTLSAAGGEDFDQDGATNFGEFAFGTAPEDPSHFRPMEAQWSRTVPRVLTGFSFRRRAGSILNYVVESSPDLQQWTPLSRSAMTVRNLFDGTGVSEVVCTWPAAPGSHGFLRVRASPRQ